MNMTKMKEFLHLKSKGQAGGINTIVQVVILLLVALALLPTVIAQTTNSSLYPGASSTVLTILGLVPLLYCVGILSIAGIMIYLGYIKKG